MAWPALDLATRTAENSRSVAIAHNSHSLSLIQVEMISSSALVKSSPLCRPTSVPVSLKSTSNGASARCRISKSSAMMSPCAHDLSRAKVIVHASEAVVETSSASSKEEKLDISQLACNSVQYALNFARVSGTYEVHTWMLLLGILKEEKCKACTILKNLGLDDLYGAWHEVLWAMQVSDGLTPRAYVPDLVFTQKALRIIRGATNFAGWAGRTKVQSEDFLMALAAGDVLKGLFPDLPLDFDSVRKAAAEAGCPYILPGDDESETIDTKADDIF